MLQTIMTVYIVPSLSLIRSLKIIGHSYIDNYYRVNFTNFYTNFYTFTPFVPLQSFIFSWEEFSFLSHTNNFTFSTIAKRFQEHVLWSQLPIKTNFLPVIQLTIVKKWSGTKFQHLFGKKQLETIGKMIISNFNKTTCIITFSWTIATFMLIFFFIISRLHKTCTLKETYHTGILEKNNRFWPL